MADDDFKQKRNKPCESCRTHRRRCILLQQNLCERCQRLAIPCFFKFSTKPNAPKKSISASKKKRMFKKIWLLEQEATLLETELDHLIAHRRKQAPSPPSWQVCIRRLQHQLVMETNITSIGELVTLIQQVSFNFRLDHIPRHPTQPALTVTFKATPFEKAIRDLFTTLNSSDDPAVTPPSTPPSPHKANHRLAHQITSIKQQLIDIYFTCLHLHNPVLIESYYRNYMHQHLDDMITWAVVAYTAYSTCHHVSRFFEQPHALTRQQVGESCRLEAKRLFDEAIFSDPSTYCVKWVFTAYLLTHCACSTLQNRQAHMYGSLAWQMAVQLKPAFVPDDDHHGIFSDAWILAETWRRLYPLVRFFAISFSLVNDKSIDLDDFSAHAIGIAFPQLHPSEQKDHPHAVLAYHDLAKLHHVAFCNPRVSTLSFHLYTGNLSSVHSNDAIAMETRFIEYWHSLAPEHRLFTAPLNTIFVDSIIPSGFLRVNAAYYIMLMSTMLRFMPSPATCDLTNVSMDRMDGAHALLVVSICCDCTITIYSRLLKQSPCMIQHHWLVIVLDTVMMLIHAKDPFVKRRAMTGARIAKDILTRLYPDYLTQGMVHHLKTPYIGFKEYIYSHN